MELILKKGGYKIFAFFRIKLGYRFSQIATDIWFFSSFEYPGNPCSSVSPKNEIPILSIHTPPASIRFALIKHTLAVSVEPFKFSPAEPVAYELS
jgi:hypothetical protein